VLTNWYVRRSRDRFWAGVEESGAGSEAFDTLFTVLETFTRVAAPLLPLVSERIWKDLTGGRSVHHTDWPDADEFPGDDALADAMDRIRAISSTALSLRKQAGRRVRLPLASLTVVAANAEALRPFEGILRDELNVKSVELVELQDDSAARYGITSRLTVNARAAGPRLGKQVQQVIQAARAGDWTEIDGVVTVGGIELAEGEYDLVLETASGGDGTAALALLAGGGFVLLDTATTPELEAEGLARDIIRAVQDTRKAAGLDVSDRIRLDLAFEHEDDVRALDLAVDVDIAAETLALAVQLSAAESSSGGDAPGDGGLGDGASDDRAVFEQRFGAGQFANAGAFTVGVTKLS
jgi:isoleucyl-tRNA synthetase